MGDIKWIKISCDLFNDESIKLIEQMPEGDTIIVIWLKLLISTGKLNDGGLLYFKKEIPYTDETLSIVFNRPINTIRLALKTLENFGMIQITDERTIFITNWEKYQNLAGMEQIKEYNRIAKRRQREKEKELKMIACQGQCQGQVIDNHETEKEIEIEIEKEIEKKNKFNAKKLFLNFFDDGSSEFKGNEHLKEVFLSWLEYKSAIKNQYKTEKGIKTAFKDLIKFSKNDADSAKQLVEYAISREWRGIYEMPKSAKKIQSVSDNQSKTDWESRLM